MQRIIVHASNEQIIMSYRYQLGLALKDKLLNLLTLYKILYKTPWVSIWIDIFNITVTDEATTTQILPWFFLRLYYTGVK